MRRLWTTLAILILFGVGCTGILLGSFAGHAEAAKHTNKASILFIDDAAQNPAARGEIRDLRGVIGHDAVRTNLESGASWNATGQITGSDVRMRSGPSTNSDIIGYFEDGEYVTVLDFINDYWYRVQRYDGSIGYVASKYCYIL